MESTRIYLSILIFIAIIGLARPIDDIIGIIGGTKASPGEFPYVVSLIDVKRGTNRHFCGGFIYSKNYVITAAHCMTGFTAADIKIVAGEYDRSKAEGWEQTVNVKKITPHPDFHITHMQNDIAILKLSHDLVFDDYVQSVELAGLMDSIPDDFTLMGWGSTSEDGNHVDVLRKVTVSKWSSSDCTDALDGEMYTVTDDSICAGSRVADGCWGDDGGPLSSTEGKVFGLSSWSIGCARGFPAVYTEVSHFKNWVESEV